MVQAVGPFVVTGALDRVVREGENPDGAAVARLSRHTETVRNLISALCEPCGRL